MEQFRPHPDWSFIRVSDHGRVQRKKTKGRKTIDPNNFEWVDCAVWRLPPSGYCMVRIYIAGTGKSKTRYVHRLVLEAFVGPCPTGCEARHVHDHNTSNNRLENLAWGTPLENAVDKETHGHGNKGSRHGLAKLTEEDVLRMRQMRIDGIARTTIAKTFGISDTHVSKVLAGEMWDHVGFDEGERERLRHAGFRRGENHYATTLTRDKLEEAKRMLEAGTMAKDVAKHFGINRSTLHRAMRAAPRASRK